MAIGWEIGLDGLFGELSISTVLRLDTISTTKYSKSPNPLSDYKFNWLKSSHAMQVLIVTYNDTIAKCALLLMNNSI
jgi:hypothetical protein